MGEQASLAICDPSFSGTNPAASAKHNALRFDRTRLWRDGPHERNLELEICWGRCRFPASTDGESHAAVEQRGRETTVHVIGWIEMGVIRFQADDDAPAC